MVECSQLLSGAFVATAVGLIFALGATADDIEAEDSSVATSEFSDGLTADEIYQRVLDNRFAASVQVLSIVSKDRSGNQQQIRMTMMWKRYAEPGASKQGVLSKSLIRYDEPSDLRGTGYLIINKEDLPNDQFIYLRSLKRVRRINLRGETMAGTDLSLEDIVPREMDDATYTRVPDEVIDERACFVVEATPTEALSSEYSKFRLYVEKDHYVPLRTRYWDRAGVEIKELRSQVASIREIEGVWLPLRSTMSQLLDETATSLEIASLIPNPVIEDRFFTQRQLEAKKLRMPAEVTAKIRDFGAAEAVGAQ